MERELLDQAAPETLFERQKGLMKWMCGRLGCGRNSLFPVERDGRDALFCGVASLCPLHSVGFGEVPY